MRTHAAETVSPAQPPVSVESTLPPVPTDAETPVPSATETTITAFLMEVGSPYADVDGATLFAAPAGEFILGAGEADILIIQAEGKDAFQEKPGMRRSQSGAENLLRLRAV